MNPATRLPHEAQIEALKAALEVVMLQNSQLNDECTELRYLLRESRREQARDWRDYQLLLSQDRM